MINENSNYLNYLSKKYSNLNNKYMKLLNYYNKEWNPYIINDFLNYHDLPTEVKSNSYIENYNRVIKLKLSNFLLGKKMSDKLAFIHIICIK